MCEDLRNFRAIVVGGGQRNGSTIGNGKAIAKLLARAGASVVVGDKAFSRAKATADEIQEEGGIAFPLEGDVSKPEECVEIVRSGRDRLGGIDILVNNVGIYEGDSDTDSLDHQQWDLIVNTNLRSTWLLSRESARQMRAQGGGSIVNISSIAALGMGVNLAYGVSKSAVNALTKRLALENAQFGVRVNAIMPGPVETPMFESQIPKSGMNREEFIRSREKIVPLNKIGTAWDIAEATLFLSSDRANFITGAIIPVDGGIHALRGSGIGTPRIK